jgi:hypothetical protein
MKRMPAFRFFDPWAALDGAETSSAPAKVAKPAKVEVPAPGALAALAALAPSRIAGETLATTEAEFWEQAAIEERAGLTADRVPPVYLDAWARLNHQKPEGVSEAEWRQALDDGGLFLDRWGADAAALGYSPGELFDVVAGLIWRLAGEQVTGVGTYSVLLPGGRAIKRRR